MDSNNNKQINADNSAQPIAHNAHSYPIGYTNGKRQPGQDRRSHRRA